MRPKNDNVTSGTYFGYLENSLSVMNNNAFTPALFLMLTSETAKNHELGIYFSTIATVALSRNAITVKFKMR